MARSGRLSSTIAAPRAEQRAHHTTHHGIRLDDPWHWLRDPAYPALEDASVRAYLEAENAYHDDVMAPLAAEVEALYAELRGRVDPEEASVPWHEGRWTWRWYYPKGAQYRCWARRPRRDAPIDETGAREGAGEADDESVVLDENALAEGLDYFDLGVLEADRAGEALVYGTDTEGSERYRLRVRDLAAGRDLDDEIADTLGAVVWSADGSGFYYTPVNDQWRPWQVRFHRLGSDPAEDRLVYQEDDESFWVSLDETSDRRYGLVCCGDHSTSEVRLLELDGSHDLSLVAARRTGHEYDVDHGDGRLWIRSNDGHENFRLLTADAATPRDWQLLRAGSDEVYLTGLQAFAGFVVLEQRIAGLDAIEILPSTLGPAAAGAETGSTASAHHVAFPEATFSAGLGTNAEFDTRTLRLGYSSLVTPDRVYDYDVDARTLTLRKERAVPSGHDASRYVSERLTVTARDGTAVPVSLVRRRDLPLDGSAPAYLYGYGAYGISIPPSFSAARLSLLERGFVFAIAHIRGGDDLGRAWYRAGTLAERHHTFDDFVDVAGALVERGYTRAGRIAISGGSAGGELVAVAMNQAPELWGAVVAHVPFVDVLQTMLDASLPLTPMEWPEWGNPLEDRDAFDTIRSYSPIENLQARAYPPLFATAGLTDPRVTYWEPAKWVARQRALRTDEEIVLLRTHMQAGHAGRSGRFEALREIAEEYAFVLGALGEPPPG